MDLHVVTTWTTPCIVLLNKDNKVFFYIFCLQALIGTILESMLAFTSTITTLKKFTKTKQNCVMHIF